MLAPFDPQSFQPSHSIMWRYGQNSQPKHLSLAPFEAYFSPAIPSCGGYGQIPKASCWHHSTKLSFHHGYGHVPKSIYIAGTIRSNFQPGHSIMWRLWPFPKAAIAGTSPLELSFACIAQQAAHATSSSNPNSPGGHRSLADLTSCSSPHGPAAPYGARSAA